MKCLLVMPRWSEEESLSPPSGRPHLDLLLNCLGFYHLGVLELEPEAPFDPTDMAEDIRLILVQGQFDPSSSRLRRSLLSNLGLSLGLDGNESDRLRVVGARPLYDPEGNPAGFAIKRRGRIVAFFEQSIWELRQELVHVVRSLLEDEGNFRRPRFDTCWLIEGSGNHLNLSKFMGEEESSQCQIRYLPDGDAALLMSSTMGAEFKSRLQGRLDNLVYSLSPQPLEALLGDWLKQTKLKIATAESCTAGLIAARLSSVPGSSAFLTAGYITYSNLAKSKFLEVPPVLIERCGAVSPEVALTMARSALRSSEADLAVSVTGIAGPGGGTPEKPVGTVHLAVVSQDGGALEHKGFYKGGRDRIRYQSSQTAMHLVRRMLLSQRRNRS